MCWLIPLIGTAIGAILGYLIGRESNRATIEKLTDENAHLSAKVSSLAHDVNLISHYRDKLKAIKSIVTKYVDENMESNNPK